MNIPQNIERNLSSDDTETSIVGLCRARDMRARFFVIVVLVSAAGACSGAESPTTAMSPTDDAASMPMSDGAPFDRTVGSTDGADAQRGDPPSPDVATDVPLGDGAASSDGSDAPRTVGALYCPPGAPASTDPFPADRTPTLVPLGPPGGISFLEGPVWLADRGVLLLSEWNGGHRILQVTPPQAIDVFLPATGTNGLAVTPDGKALLVVTEMPAASVSRIDLADKNVQPLVRDYNGQGFIQPNDLAVRADGTIYFTDYQAGRLYRRALDGSLSIVSSLPRSNGVGLAPDEKTLYLNADTHTVKYPLGTDGTVGMGTDLATGLSGADGIAIDCAGNVFIAQNSGGSVVVVSAGGTRLGELGGLPRVVTNAAFGGDDRRTLYITTNSALYAIKLEVPGLPY
jgi:gluconolactonase